MTGQRSIAAKNYSDDEEWRLLVSKRRIGAGRKAKLTKMHSQFLVEYVNENSSCAIGYHERFLRSVPGLSISMSAQRIHLVQKYNLTLAKLQKQPIIWDSDRVLKE